MSLLDISILTVCALGGLRGVLRGLIKEAAALLALILGGWIAYRFHPQAAHLLAGLLPPTAAHMVAFVVLLILVGLAAHLVGNLLTGLLKLALLGWVNRLGGLLLGCVEGGLLLGMFFYAVLAIPFPFTFKTTIQQHPVALQLARYGGMALDRAKTLRQQLP